MAAEEKNEEKAEARKSSPIVLIAVMAVMSALAVGAGYGVSSVFKSSAAADSQEPEKVVVSGAGKKKNDRHDGGSSAKKSDGHDEKKDEHAKGGSAVVKLEPVIVTLSKNDNAWLRLELALVIDDQAEKPGELELTQIASDVSGMLRTMDLQHISKPSGYVHLREDLLDRARMTAGETVRDVMIVTLVAE